MTTETSKPSTPESDATIEALASRLADANRQEEAWFLRGVLDAINHDDRVEGSRSAGPFARHYLAGASACNRAANS